MFIEIYYIFITNVVNLFFSDLAKAILSLLIACIKGKIKMTMGLSILSDIVSIAFEIHYYIIFIS
jgi:hypothetical protein